mgnify:CR=1 FL=1
MGFFDALDSVLNVTGKIAPIASAGYNIYSGINNANAAGEYYDTLAGTAELQDKIAKEQWAINKPLMQKQGALSGLEMDKAIERTPGILSAQYDLYDRGLEQQGLDMDLYGQTRGILNKFFTESEDGINPQTEMNRSGLAVENAMAGAQGQLSRNLSRRGIQLGGDQAVDATNQSLINKALGKAAARNEAFRAAKETNYSRLGNAANVRSGMGATVTAPKTPQINLGNPAASLAASAATTGQLAQGASQAASAAFNSAGYDLARQY